MTAPNRRENWLLAHFDLDPSKPDNNLHVHDFARWTGLHAALRYSNRRTARYASIAVASFIVNAFCSAWVLIVYSAGWKTFTAFTVNILLVFGKLWTTWTTIRLSIAEEAATSLFVSEPVRWNTIDEGYMLTHNFDGTVKADECGSTSLRVLRRFRPMLLGSFAPSQHRTANDDDGRLGEAADHGAAGQQDWLPAAAAPSGPALQQPCGAVRIPVFRP